MSLIMKQLSTRLNEPLASSLMLRNITYVDPPLEREIEKAVGKSFSFAERWRMKGNGSPRLLIHEASPDIKKILEENTDLKYCYAELRQKGMIIRFQSRLETFGLIIPYYRLTFYQNGSQWSFHSEGHFIKASSTISGESVKRFKMNVMQQKVLSQGDGGPNAGLN